MTAADDARRTRAAQAAARRTRPEGLDLERVAQAVAASHRTPTVARLLRGDIPEPGPGDPLEVTDAEAAIVTEYVAAARRIGADVTDTILAITPAPEAQP